MASARTFAHDADQDRIVRENIVADTSGAFLSGSGTGAGKTLTAIRGGLERKARRVLIIAQPKVFENFDETLRAFAGFGLRPCGNSAFADFSAAESKANMHAAATGEDGWFFVSREMFSRQCWVTKTVKGKKVKSRVDFWSKKRPFDYVVYDECQMVSNKTSASHKSLAHLRRDFLVIQSADWFGSFIENQWSISKLAWPDWVDMNHATWIDEYCTTEYDHFSYTKKKVTGEIWPGYWASSLPNYVALPSPIGKPEITQHYIDLSRAEKRLYDELNDKLAAEIDGDVLVIDMTMHLKMRLRELTLGMFHVDYVERKTPDGFVEMKQTIDYREGDPSTTIDAIKQIQRDYPGEPIIVLSHSAKWARKAAKDLGGVPYTGSESSAFREDAKQRFLRGEVKVLVGTEAMAEGLDGLQEVCRIAVIASRSVRSYMIDQFLGRIARRGQEREPLAFEIVRRHTVDVGVVAKSIERVLMNNAAKALARKDEGEG